MMPPIKALVVDDSAFARKVVRELLSSTSDVAVVGTARDGEEALELTASLNPDVVVCDLHMPGVDGVDFVRRQMRVRPLPILILSSAAQDTAEVVEALGAGAIDVVTKPSALATENLRDISSELIAKVKTAARSMPLAHLCNGTVLEAAPRNTHPVNFDVVVIAISTGGPQALRRVLPMLPADFAVPIAIVLHMPVGYTALYAQKLDELCTLEVKEAQDGDELRPGRVLLAQAGRHLQFVRTASGAIVASLSLHPLDKIHRPSADVLFRSAADVFGERVLAVVMTGMGNDGLEGAAWIKAQGGTILTESEKTCVIYGMPRSVDEAGLSDASIPLDGVASALISRL